MLVQKGKFDLPTAVAIAEALDMTLVTTQVVTVPLLDARLAVIRSDMREFKAEVAAEFKAAEARTHAKLQRMKTDLIFWIIGAVAGTAFFPKLVALAVAAAQNVSGLG
jgi:hypothetical protein